MPSSTIKMLKGLFTSYGGGGGCGCGRPKPKEVYDPKPKAEASKSFDHYHKPIPCYSSSSSWERGAANSIDDDPTSSTTHSFNNNNNDTSTNCSEHGQHNASCSKMLTPIPRFGDSVAIVKDSEDPYQDFRQSMIQMIVEKEISSKDDLQDLLNCFLQLNSSSHHRIIVQAFMDIWNGVVSKKPAEDQQHHDQIVS